MKVRHYRISNALIAHAFQTGTQHEVRVKAGLPGDAIVRGAFSDERGWITLVVESTTFTEVEFRAEPPIADLVMESIQTEKGETRT